MSGNGTMLLYHYIIIALISFDYCIYMHLQYQE